MIAAKLVALLLAQNTVLALPPSDTTEGMDPPPVRELPRILQGTIQLAEGEAVVTVLRLDEGDEFTTPMAGRFVPAESWVVFGKERAELQATVAQLQGKPEWWMLGVGMFLASAIGVGAAALVLGR